MTDDDDDYLSSKERMMRANLARIQGYGARDHLVAALAALGGEADASRRRASAAVDALDAYLAEGPDREPPPERPVLWCELAELRARLGVPDK